MERFNRQFVWIGYKLDKLLPNVKYELAKADLPVNPVKYLAASFFSALVYGVVFFFFLYSLFFFRDGIITPENSILSGLAGLISSLFFFALHIAYPGIVAKKYAAGIDSSLMFALKSMLIQVTSGVSLFNAMLNVSKSNYGVVSKEFENVVKDISAGESEAHALEKLALKTRSEYLKKTSWQLLNSLNSGASLRGALATVVESLNSQQLRAIKDYAAELNLWILLYLLLAAAIPTMGITFLVIMSAMAGLSIGPEALIFIILFAGVMQVVLIGFVKTRIPKVFLQ